MPAGLPLAGVTVVSLEQAVAAPLATRHLADLGARVIKVERPEGDFARRYDRHVQGQSTYFVWANRSKESVVLDLKSAFGRAALDRLLERADVFVQNLAPGAVERLGLGVDDLRRRYPDLVTCSISGYGSGTEWAPRKAYDLLIQGESGLLNITGAADEPARVGVSLADIAAGIYAFSGILTALYRRAMTGEATAVDVAMLEALGEWMGQPMYYTRYTGAEPPRLGVRHARSPPTAGSPRATGRSCWPSRTNGSGPRCASGCSTMPDSSAIHGSPTTPPGSPTATSSKRSSAPGWAGWRPTPRRPCWTRPRSPTPSSTRWAS
jgi:itaconate CoA-transferase